MLHNLVAVDGGKVEKIFIRSLAVLFPQLHRIGNPADCRKIGTHVFGVFIQLHLQPDFPGGGGAFYPAAGTGALRQYAPDVVAGIHGFPLPM